MVGKFFDSQSGAVTVDWVVLTAGLVGLGLATMAVVSTGVQDTSGDVEAQLTSSDIIGTGFRSNGNMEYGLWGFTVVNQTMMNNAEADYSGLSASDLVAAYIERENMLFTTGVPQGASGGGVGKGVRRAYHDLGYIAQELEALGEPLPAGTLLPNEAGDLIRLYEPCFNPGEHAALCSQTGPSDGDEALALIGADRT